MILACGALCCAAVGAATPKQVARPTSTEADANSVPFILSSPVNRRKHLRSSARGARQKWICLKRLAVGTVAGGLIMHKWAPRVRCPSGWKWTRKRFASWDRQARCCARLSLLQAQKRQVLAGPVLYRSGAPDTIRTCDLCLRRAIFRIFSVLLLIPIGCRFSCLLNNSNS